MRSVSFWVIALATALCCGAMGLEKLNGGRISGSVFDNMGAVVPGTTLTFRKFTGKPAIKRVISGSDGSYTVELPIGEYDVLAEKHAFCPFKRGAFRVSTGADANLNIRIQPCGIAHSFSSTQTGEMIESAESIPRQDYDAFIVQNGKSKTIKLTMRFAQRHKQDKTLTYTAVGSGENKAPVVVTFDLISIVADKVRLNVDDRTVLADGNVIVEDGKRSAKASSAELRFHKGQPVLTHVPR